MPPSGQAPLPAQPGADHEYPFVGSWHEYAPYIVQQYRKGATCAQVGAQLGCSASMVNKVLVRAGEPRRPRGTPGLKG